MEIEFEALVKGIQEGRQGGRKAWQGHGASGLLLWELRVERLGSGVRLFAAWRIRPIGQLHPASCVACPFGGLAHRHAEKFFEEATSAAAALAVALEQMDRGRVPLFARGVRQ